MMNPAEFCKIRPYRSLMQNSLWHWDAYPDLPDLAPYVKAVCIKDHLGGRAEADFPVPGSGQIDHALMFRTLFAGGFRGPLAVERVDGKGGPVTPEILDQRIAQAYNFLAPLLEKTARS